MHPTTLSAEAAHRAKTSKKAKNKPKPSRKQPNAKAGSKPTLPPHSNGPRHVRRSGLRPAGRRPARSVSNTVGPTCSVSLPPPWLRLMPQYGLTTKSQFFEAETAALLRYLGPTKAESEYRTSVITAYSRAISSRFPSTTTYPFGSTATGLYLPHCSDIDLAVLERRSSSDEDPQQGNAKKKLAKLQVAFHKSITVQSIMLIRHARVPILKIVDKSGVQVDISYGQQQGVEAVDIVSSWMKQVDGLKELVILVKFCLSSQNDTTLTEVFHGGIGKLIVFLRIFCLKSIAGGYSIVALCLAFLSLSNPKPNESSLPSPQHRNKKYPASTFLEFCTFISTFPFTTCYITFIPTSPPTAKVLSKSYGETDCRFENEMRKKQSTLQLMNPLDPRIDLTIACHKFSEIVNIFRRAKNIVANSASLMKKRGSVWSSIVFVSERIAARQIDWEACTDALREPYNNTVMVADMMSVEHAVNPIQRQQQQQQVANDFCKQHRVVSSEGGIMLDDADFDEGTAFLSALPAFIDADDCERLDLPFVDTAQPESTPLFTIDRAGQQQILVTDYPHTVQPPSQQQQQKRPRKLARLDFNGRALKARQSALMKKQKEKRVKSLVAKTENSSKLLDIVGISSDRSQGERKTESNEWNASFVGFDANR